MRASRWCGVVVAAVGVVACGGEAPALLDEHFARTGAGLAVSNGKNLNGKNLNGKNLNGDELNEEGLARMLVSVNYAGAWLEPREDASAWSGNASVGLAGML